MQRLSLFDIRERDRSLQVLNTILSRADARQRRSALPLAKFEGREVHRCRFALDWYFAVAEWSRGSLDIAKTPRIITKRIMVNGKEILDKREELIWTQGSNFNFPTGATFYDTPQAYQDKPPDVPHYWKDVVGLITIAIQILEATPTKPATPTRPREPGTAHLQILAQNETRTGLEVRGKTTLTQDELVRILIQGSPADWSAFVPELFN